MTISSKTYRNLTRQTNKYPIKKQCANNYLWSAITKCFSIGFIPYQHPIAPFTLEYILLEGERKKFEERDILFVKSLQK